MPPDVPVALSRTAGQPSEDVVVRWRGPATVGDLAEALSLDTVLVDGQPLPADLALDAAPLVPGARLHGAGVVPLSDGLSGTLLCRVTGTGRAVALGPTPVRIGRAPESKVCLDDPEVSWEHAEVLLTADGAAVRDLGSLNGTRLGDRLVGPEPERWDVGELLQIGGSAFVLAHLAPARGLRLARGGEPSPFHRSPRSSPPAPPTGSAGAPLAVQHLPSVPDPSSASSGVSITAIASPLVLGGVLYATTHQVSSVGYTLAGEVAVLGTLWETRRRGRRDRARALATRTAGLERLRSDLRQRRDAELTATWRARPTAAECVQRAQLPAATLWERRRADTDFLQLLGGVGSTRWQAPLPLGVADDEVREAAAELSRAEVAPVTVDLGPGRLVSLDLPRPHALGVARALLVQALALHGPADLTVAGAVGPQGSASDWSWLRWAPHTAADGIAATGSGGDLEPVAAAAVASSRSHLLLVCDGEGLLPGASPTLVAGLAAKTLSVLVVGGRAAEATSYLAVGPSASRLVLRETATGQEVTDVQPSLLDAASAAGAARALARCGDPLVADGTGGVPERVLLRELLPDCTPDGVLQRWSQADRRSLRIPLGIGRSGTYQLDLVSQGPHALVGGTSGSGKSELLKSFCLALAATYSPQSVLFGLFDFKGGTGLQELRRLPHCVGLVSDTDLLEAERALRYLRAELLHREELLLAAGVGDIADYPGILPRLVVIIDEFQILADELPDLLKNVIDITKRGRSLGVHLVFATQSPASVRNYDELKKNTRIRVTLRLEDAADSVRLIEVPDAASFSRSGQALARMGVGALETFQTAWTGAPAGSAVAAQVQVLPWAEAGSPAPWADDAVTGDTDLDTVLAAVEQAAARSGHRPGPDERVWPDPLPPDLTQDQLPPDPSPERLPIGLGDVPEATRELRRPLVSWDLAAGNLLVHGVIGSGTTSTLLTLATGAAERWSPDEAHLVALDFAGGDLGVLRQLPHCAGNVITAAELERQAAAIAHLRAEAARRAKLSPEERGRRPRLLLLIDHLGSLVSTYGSASLRQGNRMLEDLVAVMASGPGVGIWTAATVNGTSVPHAVSAAVHQRLVLALADLRSYSELEVAVSSVPRRPGRGLWKSGRTAVDVQVALPTGGIAAALQRVSPAPASVFPPPVLRELPTSVPTAQLQPALRLHGDLLDLPVGLAAGSVTPAVCPLGPGGRLFVYGPARSGKTTLLVRTAELLVADGTQRVLAVAPAGSALLQVPGLARAAADDTQTMALVEVARLSSAPVVVLVDDVGRLGSALSSLLDDQPPHVRLVVAGRLEHVRAPDYDTPAYRLRTAEQRLVLQPDPATGDPVTGRYFDYGVVPRGVGRGVLVTPEGDQRVQT